MSEEEKKEEKIQGPELLEGVDEAKDLKKEFENVSKERDEYLDGWRRTKADLINYKKEELKRLEEVAKFGNEEVTKDLISVLDSFELAISTLEKSDSKLEKGIYMIKSQLEDVLKKRGLSRIKVAVNDKFDANFHEAVANIEGDGVSGTIAEEVEAGYMLYDKVVRAARIKLFK